MKANFPVDYMAAVLTADAGDVEKIAEIVAECSHIGLAILPPSINESRGTFTVVDEKTIRFGLYSIKNFGTGVADSIIAAREEGGRYISVADFLARVPDKNLNRRQLESLIECGALDELGERGSLLASIDNLLSFHKETTGAPQNQASLFGSSSSQATLSLPPSPPALMAQKLLWEKELLGLYVSGHPLDQHLPKLTKQKSFKELKESFPRGIETVIGGYLENTKPIATKNGEQMLFGLFADKSSSVEIVVFPRTLKEYPAVFVPGTCILLKGKFSDRNGQPSFMVDKAKTL